MKQILRNKYRIVFPPLVFLAAALLLLTVPVRWLLAALCSGFVHELCHVLVIRFFGLKIHSVHIGINGARIKTEPMTCIQELFCALAGPLGALSLLFFAKWIPRVAICAAFQSLYNLFPVYPSDGGRILYCCAKLLLPDSSVIGVSQVVGAVFLFCAVAIGIYGTFFLHLGLVPILIAWSLVFRSIRNKNSLQTGPSQGTIVVSQK